MQIMKYPNLIIYKLDEPSNKITELMIKLNFINKIFMEINLKNNNLV